MLEEKCKGNLWTSVRDPNFTGHWGKATPEQLKALEKAILEFDLEKFKEREKAEQKTCLHARVYASINIDTRNFYWESRNYLCMDCGLDSESGIGIYARN